MSDAVTNVTWGGSWGPSGTMTPAAKHEGTKYQEHPGYEERASGDS